MTVEVYTPLKQFEEGDKHNQVYLIGEIKHNEDMHSKWGDLFARITVQDKSGMMHGVLWRYKENEVQVGSFVKAEAIVKNWSGQIQVHIDGSRMNVLRQSPVNLYDFIKGHSQKSLGGYASELENYVTMLADEDYRNLMEYAVHSLDIINALRHSSYGLSGSMAYPGGLLVHVVNSLRVARAAVQQAREAEIPFNPSLVIVGCILRNIGWHTIAQFHGNVLRPRNAFYTTGLYRASARYVDHALLSVCAHIDGIDIPEGKKQALHNLCNPTKDIRTLEGRIVAQADNIADTLDAAADILGKKPDGDWTPDIEGLFTGHLS